MTATLVWHRGDLRIHDHPPLHQALVEGEALGLVVLDPAILDDTSPRRRAWFIRNVRELRRRYRERGGELVVREGPPWEVLPEVTARVEAAHVRAIRSYTPYGMHRDRRTADSLPVPLHWHGGMYVHEPGSVVSGSGDPYRLYGAFFRRWRGASFPNTLPPPDRIRSPSLRGVPVGRIPAADSDIPLPPPGEERARERWDRFLGQGIATYHEARDRLDGAGTSQLSPYINLGVLSSRVAAGEVAAMRGDGPRRWLGELAWRDFLADLLLRYPTLTREPLDRRWARFEWTDDRQRLPAWRDGRTGFPAVDAAMRQLRATGWISNRARMVAGQFLVKHLRVDWREGERVFKEWLLDGDTAQNAGNWQWVAGAGVDNVPYFRVFNPVTQGREHDPDGRWLARWAPRGDGSPEPGEDAIVDLASARSAYLEAAKRVASAGPDVPEPQALPRSAGVPEHLTHRASLDDGTAARVAEALPDGDESSLREVHGVGEVRAREVLDLFPQEEEE
jgi:deoxyribodipyrimidine photo-lyase